MNQKIIVLGAYGFTGRLVVERLLEKEIPFIAAGRDEQKLKDLKSGLKSSFETLKIDIKERESWPYLLQENSILINCVGPFNLFAREFIKEVMKSSISYVDITGELSFVNYSHQLSKETDCQARIIHSCSFEAALSDFLAKEICCPDENYEEISSYYYLPNPEISPGTRFTMKLASFYDHEVLHSGEFVTEERLSNIREVDLEPACSLKKSILVPYPEMLFFKKVYHVQETGSYFISENPTLPLSRMGGKKTTQDMEKVIHRFSKKKSKAPDPEARSNQEFSLYVQNVNTKQEKSLAWLKGKDPYGLTASLVLLITEQLLADTSIKPGFLTPAETVRDAALFAIFCKDRDLKLEIKKG